MQGLKRLQEAIERHRENKDINIKYKTPLTSKSESTRQVACVLLSLLRISLTSRSRQSAT